MLIIIIIDKKLLCKYEMDKDDNIYRIRNNINTGNYIKTRFR